MRPWSRIAVVTGGIAVALTVASPDASAFAPKPAAATTVATTSAAAVNVAAQAHSAAAATVSALADADAARAAMPRDFADRMGYEPQTATLADGTVRLVNPRGSCSVPGHGRPFDFDVACQAHDFGYDLLRYAERSGDPLPGSARDRIDSLLDRDLGVQCTDDPSPLSCAATVQVFSAGVGFNSWRQLSGPPVDESGLTRTAGLGMLVGLGGPGLLASWWRRRRGADRRDQWPGTAPAQR